MIGAKCWRGSCGVVMAALVCATGPGARLGAQTPGTPSAETAGDSIRCWWKSEKDAVLVGEQFTLALTCGVLETNRVRAVADAKQFQATALPLAPFEVLGSTPHDDIQSPPWRYFQHEYTLRLLGEEFFGQDVDIPALKIAYGMRSASTGEAEGRDQTIVLPALPMHVQSLVPKNARNIRDEPNETFGDIEARLGRARSALTAAGIFFGFTVVLLGLAARQMVGRYTERAPARNRPLSAKAVLRGCLRAIGPLKADIAREGWTDEIVGRALALLRIAGAVATGRPVAQSTVETDVDGQAGQLVVDSGMLPRKRTLVSAATTADAIAGQLATGEAPKPDVRTALEQIRDSLGVFSAAHYSLNGHPDTTALDAALADGTSALRRLRVSTRWPARTADALSPSIGRRRVAT